jgi:hypothetical protein
MRAGDARRIVRRREARMSEATIVLILIALMGAALLLGVLANSDVRERDRRSAVSNDLPPTPDR